MLEATLNYVGLLSHETKPRWVERMAGQVKVFATKPDLQSWGSGTHLMEEPLKTSCPLTFSSRHGLPAHKITSKQTNSICNK